MEIARVKMISVIIDVKNLKKSSVRRISSLNDFKVVYFCVYSF
jgi:hypothetical protein